MLGINTLKTKAIWLGIVPLVAAIGAMGGLLWLQAQSLEREQARLQEEALLAVKREDLRHYTQLALTSIDHLYATGRNDAATMQAAQQILRVMNFGEDGYFFVYDLSGRNLVHPRLKHLEGRDLRDLQDEQGVYVIRELIARALEGGGFQRYQWNKPSTGKSTPKLAYAVLLPRWGWMIGTGLYLDDIDAAASRMRSSLVDSMRKTLIGFGAVGIVAILFVFAGGMILNISEQRLADRKMRLLADRVVVSQEEERARVSRELHDNICQLLVSIKYQFELAAHRVGLHAPGSGYFDKEIGSLSRAIGEVRRISHDLRPALLDDLGLPAALELLGSELAVRTGLKVSVSARLRSVAVSQQQAVESFRIAQEALHNVEAHSRASHVQLVLSEEAGSLCLCITDDGCGFDVQQVIGNKDRGIGLSNMRQRAARLGGRFEVRSTPEGTAVKVWMPAEEALA